jgi:hypothetical protein
MPAHALFAAKHFPRFGRIELNDAARNAVIVPAGNFPSYRFQLHDALLFTGVLRLVF